LFVGGIDLSLDVAAELSRWFGLTLVGDIMVGVVGKSKN
jgi:hypothetical protein